MKVAILCGGYGTRIRDVSEDIPKPMIPIGGLPILWHIMKYYSHWKYNQFVLCLGYKGQVIKDFFLNYESHTRDFTIKLGSTKSVEYHNEHAESDWQITLADTGLDAMTGARVKRIEKYMSKEENFMLTYGDGVGNIDLDKLVQFHLEHGKILTVTGVRPPGRFGELMNDSEGKVLEFNEKPQASGGRISGGFFVCRKELFKYLDNRENLVFEQEPMRQLVRDGQMMVYEHDGFWQPMDTYRDYSLLKGLSERGEAPWKVW
jgi:glucose-1-phosphate cytidylyltransferase